MNNSILTLIKNLMPDFSKSQKRIAAFVTEHYEKASFMTASKLGDTVGVSESTVVRFATVLGFEGYPEFQKALQEITRNRLTAVQRMEITTQMMQDHDVLTKVLNSDIEKIRRTLEETNHEHFEEAVNAIASARRIYIIGVGSSASLARFVSFYFNHIFDNVNFIETTSSSEMFERIMRINENDVLFGISFPRYSSRTSKALLYAKERGAKVIALTDSVASPIAEMADLTLLAKSDMASFVDSLVAPLSLLNALIVAVGIKRQAEVTESLNMLEHIWDEYEVYQKSENINE